MRERLDDKETRRRLLTAAQALVVERDVSTGLEHVPFEEVIRVSGVSRTSAYRCWPNREHFHGETLLQLARGTALPSATEAMIGMAANLIDERAAHLGDPQGRRALVVELLRVAIDADFVVMRDSAQWRTFLTLTTGHTGISNPELRRRIAEELIRVEQRSIDNRARAYADLTSAIGYRLRYPLAGPSGYDLMSTSSGATLSGFLAKVDVQQPATMAPRRLRAFGSTEAADWLPVTYAVAGVVLSFIEPDPGVRWDTQRVGDLLRAITWASPEERGDPSV